MWGVSVPPESPSMNPETGRFSATNVLKVMKVAENQNGKCQLYDITSLPNGFVRNFEAHNFKTFAHIYER